VCYGVGHFLNDMTAAAWFNYLLVFLVQVQHMSPSLAAVVLLCGQIADGIANPLIGVLSDKTTSRFGKRKTWLLVGAVVVNATFFFVFSDCWLCEEANLGSVFTVVWFSIFASLFNVGWAAVQVSHMALVPELTANKHERVKLNSARYAGGIVATLAVLGVAEAAFRILGVSQMAFFVISAASLVLGDILTLVFLFGVHEKKPSEIFDTPQMGVEDSSQSSGSMLKGWIYWFKTPMFYQVGIVYMASRACTNVSQVFMPFFLRYSLDRESVIAEVPLALMGASFVTTFVLRRVNKFMGRLMAFVYGVLFMVGGLVVLFFVDERLWFMVFPIAVLLGVGSTIMLVTATTMEADLIGKRIETGAFVFGTLSLADKFSSGVIVQVTASYTDKATEVRYIITFVSIGCALVALVFVFTIVQYWTRSPASKFPEYSYYREESLLVPEAESEEKSPLMKE